MNNLSSKDVLLIAKFLNVNTLEIQTFFKKGFMCSDSPLTTINNGNLLTKTPDIIFGKNLKILGKGGFGKVYRSTQNYALKYMAKQPDSIKEIALLQYLDHPNIQCIHGLFEYDIEVGFAMNVSDIGTLYDIYDQLKNISDLRINAYYQIFCGLAFIHSVYVFHCDVKPANILVFKQSGNYTFKVSDLGLAITCTYVTRLNSIPKMTRAWRPPEILNELLQNNSMAIITDKIDIWPMGIIMYDVIYQKSKSSSIYVGSTDVQTLQNIMTQNKQREDLLTAFVKGEKELADFCLTINPLKRPNAIECLKDSLFKDFKKSDDMALITNNKKSDPTIVKDYEKRKSFVKYIYNIIFTNVNIKTNITIAIYTVTLIDIYFSTLTVPIDFENIQDRLTKYTDVWDYINSQLHGINNNNFINFVNLSLKKSPTPEEIDELNTITKEGVKSISFGSLINGFKKIMESIPEEFASIKKVKTMSEYKQQLFDIIDKITMYSFDNIIKVCFLIALFFVDTNTAKHFHYDFTNIDGFDDVLEVISNNLYCSNAVQYYTYIHNTEPDISTLNKIMEKLMDTPDQKSIVDLIST